MGLSPVGWRIAIVAAVCGAFMVIGPLLETSWRLSSAGPTVTLNDYSMLRVGMSPAQVESVLGLGPGYFVPGDENHRHRFTNDDGSYAVVEFASGTVSRLSQSGLKESHGGQTAWLALFTLVAILPAAVWVAASAAARRLRERELKS